MKLKVYKFNFAWLFNAWSLPIPSLKPLQPFLQVFTLAILWLESNIYGVSSESLDKGFYPSTLKPVYACFSLLSGFCCPVSLLSYKFSFPVLLLLSLSSLPLGLCPKEILFVLRSFITAQFAASSRTKQIIACSLMCTQIVPCYNIPHTIYVEITQ